MSGQQVTPEVTWAQRSSADNAEKNYVYLTINVPDVPKDKLKLDLKPTGLSFNGTSITKKTTYHIDMEFFAEIDPDQSKINHTDANIAMVLRKKELKSEYWPRLLKSNQKMHYLKTDFDKWVDEDEQDEAGEDDYMNQFGDMGAGGMGGGFDGIDFSKLGGAGMPGMEGLAGGEGDGVEEDEDDDDDDEDMPDLEDDEPAKGKGKVEEVS